MNRKTKILALVLVFVLIMSSFALAAPKVEKGSSTVAFDKKVLARIDADKALNHISYLSETIGPRIAGTKEERDAAQYIKGQFEKMGYDVKVQKFPISNVVSNLTIDALKGRLIKVNTATGSGYTDEKGITEELVNCGFGATSSDFPAEVSGKIALVQRGGGATFGLKAQNAVNAGAIGVLMYNNVAGALNPTLGGYSSPIPYVSISLVDGNALKDAMAAGTVKATIKAQLFTESQNVIATREGSKGADSKIVYITAHYDSVPYAPGANDNASGTAMMLEFAKILKGYPIDKEIRFIACGAEEIGLLGSKYYVNQLTQPELDRSLANFNMDMIATSYEPCNILYADTVSGEPNLVTEAAEAAGMRLGNNVLAVGKGSSSDHAPFGQKGIANACFIWGDEKGNLEPWYHQPEDTIAINISLDRLQQAGEMIGSALYDVIRKETPNLTKSKLRKAGEDTEVYDFGIQE